MMEKQNFLKGNETFKKQIKICYQNKTFAM